MQLPGRLPTLARDLEPFFWIMWAALGLRPDWLTVAVTHLVFIIVSTLKMLESHVNVCVCTYVCSVLTPKNLSRLLAANMFSDDDHTHSNHYFSNYTELGAGVLHTLIDCPHDFLILCGTESRNTVP